MWNSFGKKIQHWLRPPLRTTLYRIPEKLEKLGTQYGGWIIPPQLLNKHSVCYLAGAGEDISFDVELANRFHCPVYIFDPTPRSQEHYQQLIQATQEGKSFPVNNSTSEWYALQPEAIPHVHFQPVGIWKQNDILRFFAPKNEQHISHSIANLQQTDRYFEATVKTVATVMREYGHTQLDLLKLDVEGAEYEVIENILAEKLKIKLLCVEFHLSDQYGYREIAATLQKLEQHQYRVIAREELDITLINLNLYQFPGK